jgi:hypothetical protein
MVALGHWVCDASTRFHSGTAGEVSQRRPAVLEIISRLDEGLADALHSMILLINRLDLEVGEKRSACAVAEDVSEEIEMIAQ